MVVEWKGLFSGEKRVYMLQRSKELEILHFGTLLKSLVMKHDLE